MTRRRGRGSGAIPPQLLALADEQLLEFLRLYTTSSRKPCPSARFGQALLIAISASLVIYFVLAVCAYEVFLAAR